MNRQNRRSKQVVNEIMDDLVIAGLRVTINNKMPDGIMVVSEKEGKRLSDMVAKAQAEAMTRSANEKSAPSYQVTLAMVQDMIEDVEHGIGGAIVADDYAIYATDQAIFEGDVDEYPLPVITVEIDKMPADTFCMVAKREGK